MSELIDNRSQRVQTLKSVIRGLHEGEPVDVVRARVKALVRECDASEIASMEQQLIAEGIPVAQVMGMCDLHSQAVRDVLVERETPDIGPGHPVNTFRRENGALREQVARVRSALSALGAGPEDAVVDAAPVEQARGLYGLLMDVDKHYQRKEHLLFPFLEKRGITGPSTVMWGKDDEVRDLLKELGDALGACEATVGEWRLVAQAVAEPALVALEEMIFKEEHILLPMSLQSLTEAEWGEIAAQSPQFGYCLVDPAEGWRARPSEPLTPASGGTAEPPPKGAAMPGERVPGGIVLPSGCLSLAQLTAMFETLPVDLTFVDADDRVRFFSEGPNRVFHRAKAVIGRKVQHCHPPASVGIVDRILGDFRSGARSVAEFWIQMRGRFVHIRYFALRDAGGTYLGTLEVTQDLTRERALEGDRRLLQYES
jgi:hypothetical protein